MWMDLFPLWASSEETARDFPSRDMAGSLYPIEGIWSSSLPARSNHASRETMSAADSNTTTPVSETESPTRPECRLPVEAHAAQLVLMDRWFGIFSHRTVARAGCGPVHRRVVL